MWCQSSNSSKSTIPPNLLKNFNPYDILEPQKNGAKNSDASKVDKLIDIDDSSHDSGFHEANLNAWGVDKIRGFDLVDLYQNILVTPQHIKQTSTVSNNNVTELAPSLDIDFKQFFDKLEAGQKINWMKIGQSKEETISKRVSDELLEKPKVLVPKVLTEPDSDPEDLIHEVLIQKNIEKRLLSEINHTSKENRKKISETDVINDFSCLNLNISFTKNSKFESGSNKNEPSPSEIKTCPVNSQINNSLTTFTVRTIKKDPKKKHIVKPEYQKAKFTKGPGFHEKSIILPQIMARLNARQAYLDEVGNYKKRFVLDAGTSASTKPFGKAECSKTIEDDKLKSKITQGTFTVKSERIPISKDPKLCMNQLTKSIAVHSTPCTNCIKPVSTKASNSIHGVTSPKSVPDFGKVSPKILMEDCNKERFRALKQSQMFKDFVLKGKYEI